MNLLIHDLNESEWAKIAADYEGWNVISDNGTIRPCVGCFGCWVKTPGQCVIRDGYNTTPRLIHEADEIVVMTRYTYGGFSPFVKNVFDRAIGVVLPYFEVVDGEMHHQRRYPEEKTVNVQFRGAKLSEKDRMDGYRYVAAMCRNLRGRVGDVTFTECPAAETPEPLRADASGTILLNCSLRGTRAHSKQFLDILDRHMTNEAERVDLVKWLQQPEALTEKLAGAETIVLGTPLYVDGLPSSTLRVMEALAQRATGGKRIYAVANMGLYESTQISNLLGMVRRWCAGAGYAYGGGVAVGGGEMFGIVPPERLPGKPAVQRLKRLAQAVDSGDLIPDAYADPLFPRSAYILAANAHWPIGAKQNGLDPKDLRKG